MTDIDVSDNTASSTTGTSSSTDVELTPFFSGISLDVTPQIGDDGVIILHVHPSISEVQDQTKVVALGDRSLTLPLALSTIRETDSVISAENGQIVVIGGLIQNANEEVRRARLSWGHSGSGGVVQAEKAAGTKSELVILLAGHHDSGYFQEGFGVQPKSHENALEKCCLHLQAPILVRGDDDGCMSPFRAPGTALFP